MKTDPIRLGVTDDGNLFAQSGSNLIQSDRHGNWNCFSGSVVKDSFRSFAEAAQSVFGTQSNISISAEADCWKDRMVSVNGFDLCKVRSSERGVTLQFPAGVEEESAQTWDEFARIVERRAAGAFNPEVLTGHSGTCQPLPPTPEAPAKRSGIRR